MYNRKLFHKEPEMLEKLTRQYGTGAENTGVLLYFGKVCPFLRQMDDAEAGKLFRTLIRYAMTGEEPAPAASRVVMAFEIMRPTIDWKQREFRENHARSVMHGKYMAYCREQKDAPKLTEEEFARRLLSADEEPEDTVSQPQVSDRDLSVSLSPLQEAAGSNNQYQNQEQNQNQDQEEDQKEEQDRKKDFEQYRQQDRSRLPARPREKGPPLWKTCG